jgi:Zn-dependent protease with chaperone function
MSNSAEPARASGAALASSAKASKSSAVMKSLSKKPAGTAKAKSATESASQIAARFLAALDEPIRRPRPSPLYVLALFIVATLMVLLPLVYVGIVAAAGYSVYLWAIYGTALFHTGVRGRGVIFLGLLYVTPIIAGAILVFFMLKPFLARHRQVHAPQALNRDEQPLLYAFVDKLCDKLGAPRPARIDIDLDANASASFKSTWSLLTGSLVLTIGLPLLATMTGRQFVGVLAHEFGHFAQRVAMRASFLIICVNRWFARAVYERDQWDEWLVETRQNAEHWSFQLIAAIASLFVWFARCILWVLMHVGALFSSVLMKQMEYNADRYSSRVVGSDGTIDLLKSLPLMSAAQSLVFRELDAGLREMKLPDNVPELVNRRAKEIPEKARRELIELSMKEKASLFGTHPSMGQRIAAAERDGAEGPFQMEQSAKHLVRSFDVICKLMTQQTYRDSLGRRADAVNLITVEATDEVRQERRSKHETAGKFHGALLNFWRPSAVPNESIPKGLEARCEMLLADREAMRANAEKARPLTEAWEKADDRIGQLIAVRAALAGTVRKVKPGELKLAKLDLDTVRAELRTAQADQSRRVEQLAKLIAPNLRRLQVALAIDADQHKSDEPMLDVKPEDDYGEYDVKPAAGESEGSNGLVGILQHIRSLEQRFAELRELFAQQASLLSYFDSEQKNEHYVQAVLSNGRKMFAAHRDIQSQLARVRYPFADAKITSGTLAGFAIPDLTADNDIGGLMSITESLINAMIEVYFRAWSELTVVAERVEKELGLEPLDLRPPESRSASATSKE